MAQILISLAIALLMSPFIATADTINGCVKQNNGKLRLVADLGQCKTTEAPISWNSEGPKGDPGDAQCVAGPVLRDFALVGITTATSGGFDIIWELNELCGTEFPGSQVCRQAGHVLALLPVAPARRSASRCKPFRQYS